MNIENFKYQNIKYNYDDVYNIFKLPYNKDLQLLIIWSKARKKENKIIEDLNKNFHILGCFDISWSEKYIDDNFHRLYDVSPTGGIAGKRSEVGDESFIVIVLEDKNPVYEYRSDASGRLKIVNSNIVDKKNLYRNWVGGSYMIHSTDNLNEFFNNSILFFGKKKTFDFSSQKNKYNKVEEVKSDLVGASGWKDTNELFEILNLSTQYVVLRGCDNIERNVTELTGDIDILCSNIGEFTAVANARNIWNSKNFFHVKISGNEILFDIRYIGDDYFDKTWQEEIINNRVLTKNNIYIPQIDDYFFSHLYHAYIHKPFFYEKYSERLDDLAKKINIIDFKNNILKDKQYGLKILKGYLLAKQYNVTIPKDLKVFINVDNISSISDVSILKLYFRIYAIKILNFPYKVFNSLKLFAKKNRFLFKLLFILREKYRKLVKG